MNVEEFNKKEAQIIRDILEEKYPHEKVDRGDNMFGGYEYCWCVSAYEKDGKMFFNLSLQEPPCGDFSSIGDCYLESGKEYYEDMRGQLVTVFCQSIDKYYERQDEWQKKFEEERLKKMN